MPNHIKTKLYIGTTDMVQYPYLFWEETRPVRKFIANAYWLRDQMLTQLTRRKLSMWMRIVRRDLPTLTRWALMGHRGAQDCLRNYATLKAKT